MNKQDRKLLEDLAKQLDNASLGELKPKLEAIRTSVTNLRDEQQEKFDNLPEGLQGSDRGDAFQQAIDELDDADSMLGDLESMLEEELDDDGEEEARSLITDLVDRLGNI